jgi:hypothetical protein
VVFKSISKDLPQESCAASTARPCWKKSRVRREWRVRYLGTANRPLYLTENFSNVMPPFSWFRVSNSFMMTSTDLDRVPFKEFATNVATSIGA